jgi:hypothetical protein
VSAKSATPVGRVSSTPEMHVLMRLIWAPIVALPYIVLSPIAAVGPLLGAAGVLVVSLVPYRLMTRRCVLYDNRTLLVRGSWSSVTVHASDVTDIVLRHGDFISRPGRATASTSAWRPKTRHWPCASRPV